LTKLSHLTPAGSLAMVDVAAKAETSRSARAEAFVRMSSPARRALTEATLPKGDAFVAAQLAGIMAAKQTPSLIPLAHPLPLSYVDVRFEWTGGTLRIESEARTVASTGVEMEAMVAACVAALTVYDMCKSLDKGIVVETVRLVEKRGGKSGTWQRGGRAKGARV